jgi:hypothetical protein
MTSSDFENALSRTSVVDLTTTGRVSGRDSSRPVWFVGRGATLYLLPVGGSASQWYKNILKTPAIRLAAAGAEYSARATPVEDQAKLEEVVQCFREKYGAADVKAYYPRADVAVEVPAPVRRSP